MCVCVCVCVCVRERERERERDRERQRTNIKGALHPSDTSGKSWLEIFKIIKNYDQPQLNRRSQHQHPKSLFAFLFAICNPLSSPASPGHSALPSTRNSKHAILNAPQSANPRHLRGPPGEQLPGSAEGSGSPTPHPRSVGHLGPSPRALTVAAATSGEAPETPLAPEQ